MGTPAQVADSLETWVHEADVDGFNFVSYCLLPFRGITDLTVIQGYVLFPQSFNDIADLLVPELRARGLFWDDYAVPGGTYRENFYEISGQRYPPSDHVASKHHWAA